MDRRSQFDRRPGPRDGAPRDRSMSPMRRRGSPEYGPMNGGPAYSGGGGGPVPGGGMQNARRGPRHNDYNPRGNSPGSRDARMGDNRMGGDRGYGGGDNKFGGNRGGGGGYNSKGGMGMARDRDPRPRDEYRDNRDREPYRDNGYSGPNRRFDNGRNGSPPPADRAGGDAKEPMSKILFIQERVQGDLPEREVDELYDKYLADFFQSKTKAEFEKQKYNDDFRKTYDPRVLAEGVDQRSTDAGAKAVEFATNYATNKYDWTNLELLQLMTKKRFDAISRIKSPPPPVAWLPEVISISWRVALKLVIKLDEEKRIMHDALPWVVEDVSRLRVEKAAKESAAEGGAEMEEDESEKPQDDLEKGESLETEQLESKTGQLDVMLEYLWRVHGLDYYSGQELDIQMFQASEEEDRTVRCSKPKSGTGIDDRKRETIMQHFHENVTDLWKDRLTHLDDDNMKVAELDKRVEQKVEACVKRKVQKDEESKSGPSFKCAFCNKKFKGELYVVKHMYTRHQPEVSEIKTQEYEHLYFENYKMARESEKADEGQMEEEGPMEGMYPGGVMMPMMHPSMGMGMMHPGMGMMGGPPPGPFGPMMHPPPMPYGNPAMMNPRMMAGAGGGRFGGGRGGGGRGGGRGRSKMYFDYVDLDDPGNAMQLPDYGDI